MTPEMQQEQFSRAWALGVASVAGYGTYVPQPDTDSVDIGFCDDRIRMRPRLEAQLKRTTTIGDVEGPIAYPLKIKNYQDLIGDDFVVPRILILVRVPADRAQWLHTQPHEVLMRHSAWWLSLRTLAPSMNRTSATVYIPRSQALTADALRSLMEQIATGGRP